MTESPNPTDELLEVLENHHLTESINVVSLHAPTFSKALKAGQFLEIKVSDSLTPLLRRPFSIHSISGETIEIMSKRVGIGTDLIYRCKKGDRLQTLAPLGNTFGYDKNDFDTAVLISGGIGVAPMALLEETLLKLGKKVVNIIGARNASEIIEKGLSNISVATDDGSKGFKGNSVQLFSSMLPKFDGEKLRVFSCGPNPMLSALSNLCNENSIPCEVSIESTMGCGIGICYGCPIRIKSGGGFTYKLLCQYGSVIDSREILFD
ncbi:MAG: dihydroorotate dehydrogenase electron transfer subunit [Chloroherpetonaceae bacterium]|nr:dihydroorotate dehydrogenase electron transfer subunit [Chloroherpetonaceae bacterium]